jgi:hypothetical protein
MPSNGLLCLCTARFSGKSRGPAAALEFVHRAASDDPKWQSKRSQIISCSKPAATCVEADRPPAIGQPSKLAPLEECNARIREVIAGPGCWEDVVGYNVQDTRAR